MRPAIRPTRPFFSSGPCAKRPGWSPEVLAGAATGRSHRSRAAKAKLTEVLERTRSLLRLPDNYRIGLVPASDTGAVEAALWSLLGARGVDCLAWDAFGRSWQRDIVDELRIQDVRCLSADYGTLPDLIEVDFDRDVVFVWNGTTSGVKLPDGDWIADGRTGLTLCDATSAVFSVDLPWPKLDVTTFSWQKVLGGEAQHGMIVLSPRAVRRLEEYTPPWPIPKVLSLKSKGRVNEDIFTGGATNTPSLLCVEDYLDALRWAEMAGGQPALMQRCTQNFAALAAWVERTPWIDFLATLPATRSTTSVCLKITAPWFTEQPAPKRWELVHNLCSLLEAEGVAFDIAAHRDAPPGIRIWCGATVERTDLVAVLPWLEWGYRVLQTTAIEIKK
ncbi:MAG: phosphoserine transaminase [Gammaproteobacteria bacterium]